MTREEIEELKGLAASMGLYDDKNPCKRAVILGKAIQELEQLPKLKNRCHALTHGQICVFCPYECEHKAESEGKE